MTDPQSIQFFQAADGSTVAYSLIGSGPLVCAPSWWVSHLEEDWANPAFREFWQQLGEGFTILRYDRPGVGLSKAANPLSFEAETTLLEELLDHLSRDEANMFGFSFGGPLALHYAAKWPRRVGRLVLFGTFAQGADLASAKVQKAMLAAIEAHWGLGSRLMADVFAPDATPEDRERLAKARRASCDARTAARLLALTYAADVTASLEKVGAQTLVLHRKDDRASPAAAAGRLASRLPNARLLMLEGANHLPWAGSPDVARHANSFFRSGEPAALGSEGKRFAPAIRIADRFDRAARVVHGDQGDISLSRLEFAFLEHLMACPGETISRDELLTEIWKRPFGSSNRVDVLVAGLRRKLGHLGSAVATVPGHGYRFAGWPD